MTVFLLTLAIVSLFFVTTLARGEREAALLSRRTSIEDALDAVRDRPVGHLPPPTGAPIGVAHAPDRVARR